jgi:hypothetical protein
VHGAAAAHGGVAAAGDRLEPLDVQALRLAVLAPVHLHRVDQLARAREEGLAIAPVRADVVEIHRHKPRVLAREVFVKRVARVARAHRAQVLAEDHLIGLARAVNVQDVAERVAALEFADHAPDRCHAAAGADEQGTLGERLGQAELAFDIAKKHHRPGLRLPREIRRHLSAVDVLDGDRHQPLGMIGVGCERVRAPVADAVDLDADPQVLAGTVTLPAEARANDDR